MNKFSFPRFTLTGHLAAAAIAILPGVLSAAEPDVVAPVKAWRQAVPSITVPGNRKAAAVRCPDAKILFL